MSRWELGKRWAWVCELLLALGLSTGLLSRALARGGTEEPMPYPLALGLLLPFHIAAFAFVTRGIEVGRSCVSFWLYLALATFLMKVLGWNPAGITFCLLGVGLALLALVEGCITAGLQREIRRRNMESDRTSDPPGKSD